MNKKLTGRMRSLNVAAIATFAVLLGACGGGSGTGTSAQPAADAGSAAPAAAADNGAGPNMDQLAKLVIEKINQRPEVEGAATLVDFKQVSIKTEELGDMGTSAVVECAGVVTFNKEVAWNWQGGTVKPGEPAKFEVQAEYAKLGDQGWQLVGPLGIYAL